MIPPNSLLPRAENLDAYRPIYRDITVWLPAMREICRRHNLDGSTLDFAPPGSNVVFWVENEKLIKLFPPFWAEDCARESLVLSALTAQTAIAIPRILFSGEVEGWPYLVLSRLPGSPLDEIWPQMDQPGRLRIASGLGAAMASLHQTPTRALEGLAPAWPDFLHAQIDSCLQRQRAAGASPVWLADIAAYFSDLPPLVEPGFQPVLINADLNPEHIFCRQTPDGWQVSGMIDFGDAMLGHPYYEFVAPGFIFASSHELRRAMLLAYGIPPSALDKTLSCRLTAYILLHRFIDVTQFDDLFPHRPPRSMSELEEIAWSF